MQLQQNALREQIAHDVSERARLFDYRVRRGCDI
jgi:hypothetical protein